MSELTQLIAKGEGLHLDFKFSIEDKRKIARTMVSFANAEGGSILIGVKDNGKVVGIVPTEEYYMIEAAARDYCSPPLIYEKRIWQEDHKMVLEIIIPKSEIKHKAQDDRHKWISYIRIDDHSLSGNKILDKVWKHEQFGIEKPEVFNEQTSDFIILVKINQPLSLSRIYRLSVMKKNMLDNLLAVLVYWEIINMSITENGTFYSVNE